MNGLGYRFTKPRSTTEKRCALRVVQDVECAYSAQLEIKVTSGSSVADPWIIAAAGQVMQQTAEDRATIESLGGIEGVATARRMVTKTGAPVRGEVLVYGARREL